MIFYPLLTALKVVWSNNKKIASEFTPFTFCFQTLSIKLILVWIKFQAKICCCWECSIHESMLWIKSMSQIFKKFVIMHLVKNHNIKSKFSQPKLG